MGRAARRVTPRYRSAPIPTTLTRSRPDWFSDCNSIGFLMEGRARVGSADRYTQATLDYPTTQPQKVVHKNKQHPIDNESEGVPMSDELNDSTWYHGSDKKLNILRANSSVTQNRNLARAFSHQPTLLSRAKNSVRHNGVKVGFLYVVDEDLRPSDMIPHPHPSNVGNWEMLITREVRVRLLEKTVPIASECFTNEEVAAIKKKQQELGVQSFASDEPIL